MEEPGAAKADGPIEQGPFSDEEFALIKEVRVSGAGKCIWPCDLGQPRTIRRNHGVHHPLDITTTLDARSL
jgi:hypothetical protein